MPRPPVEPRDLTFTAPACGVSAHGLKPGPALPLDWQGRFLDAYRTRGGIHRAAETAGVSPRTVERYRHADADFDAAVREAREYYADLVEETMVASADRSDNPAGFIVRLKALRPDQYIEKHAVMNFTVTTELESADGLTALQTMFTTLRPTTQSLIAPTTSPTHHETGSSPRALAPAPDGQEPR